MRFPIPLVFLASVACQQDTIILERGMTSCFAVEYQSTVQTVAACDATSLDWSNLGADLFGAPFGPDEVQSVNFIRWGDLTCEEVTQGINCGDLSQVDIGGMGEFTGGDGRANLSDFTFLQDPIDSATCSADGSFTFTLIDASDEIRMMVQAVFDERVENATIYLDETQASYVIVTSGSAEAETIPSAEGQTITLDWTEWLEEGKGSGESCGSCPGGDTLDPEDIRLVRLARYGDDVPDPRLDMVALESRVAEEVYESEVLDGTSTSIALTSLEDEDGRRFSGFDAGGSWWLALLGEASFYRPPYFLGTVGD